MKYTTETLSLEALGVHKHPSRLKTNFVPLAEAIVGTIYKLATSLFDNKRSLMNATELRAGGHTL